MFKSIFGRMFWTYAIILLFVLSSISISMTIIFTHFTERKQIETLKSVGEYIAERTINIELEDKTDSRTISSYERWLVLFSHISDSDIIVLKRDGSVRAGTCGITTIPENIMDWLRKGGNNIQKSDFGGFYDHMVLTYSFPVMYRGNTLCTIIFNRDIYDLRHTVMELLIMFALSSVASILFAFVMVYVQARNISAPIVQINNAAQRIAAGNFGERIDVKTADEIGMLASSFNFMASSIERSERNRQRFISDVSHELRTPMTSISGFVQGILDGTVSAENRDEYLKIVLEESTRLTKLVNDMLEMSKMQSDNFKLDITSFDINDLICSCLISLEKRIEEKQLDIDVDFRSDRLMVLADKNQIKRVILNLLDNAVKFSISGTTISIKTSISDGKAHVAISNIGCRIDDDDVNHLFDRFYKTDLSREKDRSGAGLGLSFVRNILQLHKQNINVSARSIDNSDNSEITFEFTLETV